MKKTDLAYAAGFFDGEGCIMITNTMRKTRRAFHLRLALTSTDPWLCNYLMFQFGGRVFQHKRGKPQWAIPYSWQIVSHQAAEFLKLIKPYLKLKRPQADIALAFQAKREMAAHGIKYSDEELAVAEAQKVLLSSLKKQKIMPLGDTQDKDASSEDPSRKVDPPAAIIKRRKP